MRVLQDNSCTVEGVRQLFTSISTKYIYSLAQKELDSLTKRPWHCTVLVRTKTDTALENTLMENLLENRQF